MSTIFCLMDPSPTTPLTFSVTQARMMSSLHDLVKTLGNQFVKKWDKFVQSPFENLFLAETLPFQEPVIYLINNVLYLFGYFSNDFDDLGQVIPHVLDSVEGVLDEAIVSRLLCKTNVIGRIAIGGHHQTQDQQGTHDVCCE